MDLMGRLIWKDITSADCPLALAFICIDLSIVIQAEV
ncbi:MAG: hypothetical protein ACI845_000801, partial [Gammaproteobacteria bacterium]